MQIIKYNTDISVSYNINSIFPDKNICYFDIETTGFGREKNFIYLIGVVYKEDNVYKTVQWFNDDGVSEKSIIRQFVDFVSDFQIVINYNGTSFDLPFVYERAKKHGINFDTETVQSFDLYKIVSKCRKFLSLNDLKQKSVELFLHIDRTDKYDGGTLINVYYDFLKNNDAKSCGLVLLHNFDDICNLVKITDILSYTDMYDGLYDVVDVKSSDNELIINCKLYNKLNFPFSVMGEHFYISAKNDKLRFLIKSEELNLKYFYPDYKNYYYLPKEDMAIHKSVAQFVDRDYKVKATKNNSYIKKDGKFIKQTSKIFEPEFKKEYSDKSSYVLLSDILNEYTNIETVKKYTLNIIKEAAH